MTDTNTTADAPAKPKRRNKPTARIKTHALPDGDPRKPVKIKTPRKPPKAKPRGLEIYKAEPDEDQGVNETARKLVAAMVQDALPRDEAIKAVGISKHYGWSLLRRPAVQALYRAELDVLRSSQQARVQHRLAEIVEQNANPMAAVQAAKLIQGDPQRGDKGSPVNVTLNIQPGYVIDPTAAFSANSQPPRLMTIEHNAASNQIDSLSRDDAGAVARHPQHVGGPSVPGDRSLHGRDDR